MRILSKINSFLQMQKSQQKNFTAFTMIELSIVLAIIGLLIVGTLQGSAMIYTTRMVSARDITQKSPVPTIPGLIAWYETSLLNSFDESRTEGASITKWNDINPDSLIKKTNILTGGTGITFKREGINKIASLDFNGINSQIALANFSKGETTQATIFVVFRSEIDLTSTVTLLDNQGGTGNPKFRITIKNDRITLDAGQPANSVVNPSLTINTDYILVGHFNRTASRIFLNDSTPLSGNLNSGPNSLIGLIVGNNRNGANDYFNGLISEIIIYGRPLKSQERSDVMRYLAKKYQITIKNI